MDNQEPERVAMKKHNLVKLDAWTTLYYSYKFNIQKSKNPTLQKQIL